VHRCRRYEVKRLGNYKEAVDLLDRERFDVVVTDMVMGVTGREGLQIVDKLARKSPVTIVVTAWPQLSVCVEVMRLGAWDYLAKQPADGSDIFENLLKSLSAACECRTKCCEGGRVHPDMAWAEDHYEELARGYAGKYVAVLDREVVGSDRNYPALAARLRSQFPVALAAIVRLPPGKKRRREPAP